MKRKNYGIQGPVLSANTDGLTSATGPAAPMQKSVVTGVNSCVFLNPSDILFYNGGQIESANANSYSVGNLREVFVEKGKLCVQMSNHIIGRGHPPSEWDVLIGGTFVADLNDYEFAYIGPGDKGRRSRLFVRSKYHLHDGIQSITFFPPDGKFLNPFTIDHLRAMHMRGGWKSVTVLPPKPQINSQWWRLARPRVPEYAALSD